MTVAQLRAWLKVLPEEADGWTIIVARDAEGNAFSPLRDVARGNYEAYSSADDDFVDEGDLALEPDLDALPLNAVCLWPVR